MGSKTINIYGFPLDISVDDVKNFLEMYTGKGTVLAVKYRLPKVRKVCSKAYAIVQFERSEDAAMIFSLAQNLQKSFTYYNTSFLKVHYLNRDIIPKPRTDLLVLEETTLHIGCLLSRCRLGVLWKCNEVEVHFGFGMKKISFLLSHGDVSYKLDLSYDSIWEIKLHSHPAQSCKFLVFQVVAAPRIYKMATLDGPCNFGSSGMNFFKQGHDDQWIRTTDFTPSCSIGQSFALCLQLQRNSELPDFKLYFSYYEEVTDNFILRDTSSYSQNLDLVPMVQPQHGVEIPYKILFKVNHMVQNCTLMGPTLDDSFFEFVNPRRYPVEFIEQTLEKMSYSTISIFNPAEWMNEQYMKYKRTNVQTPSQAICDSGLVYTRRVHITPTKIFFYGPEINVSNRVLRHYSNDIDNFIRVSFVDEDSGKIHASDLITRSSNENRTQIYWRILNVLRNGITIGNKKFDFLAFSSSQLRENSAWMFASRSGLDANDIRSWMGDFSTIRNVAKYAARLGQSFSSSTETLTVRRYEVEEIPDIINNGYTFSDGIGKISADFAQRVAIKCDLKGLTPSAFQIRYGGYKGVVAVDPTSSGKLYLRKSMRKYGSRNNKLDVLAYSKYQPCYLNRQIITLLSTLGVKDCIFENKQKDAVDQLDEIINDPVRALEVIELLFPSEMINIMKDMLLCGYKPNEEPFLSMLLQTFRASKLFDLRTKSRIFVPEGRSMIGCLDETGTLRYGQVFLQASYYGREYCKDNVLYKHSSKESDHDKAVITGKVVVAKNPCLHPGDVRVLMAIDVPALNHMVDCVVFPKQGQRPHPDECSGSDLDGDVYFVSWDPSLIPERQVPPMTYTAPPTESLDHNVTIEEVQEYFTNYMVNDSLGIIANAHTVFADKEPLKAESEKCIKLAELFSVAVDFPKAGVPAEIPSHLCVKEFPDFMEKPNKETYESNGVIGKLYRALKDQSISNPSHVKAFTKGVAKKSYDHDMQVEGFKDYVDEAFNHKEQYDYQLGCLMNQYGIKTEAEILSGCVMKSKGFNKYKDEENIVRAIKSLRKEARAWFGECSDPSEVSDLDAKASAWYYVTYHPRYYKSTNEEYNWPHFLSFAWCVHDRLLAIKKSKMIMGNKRKRSMLK